MDQLEVTGNGAGVSKWPSNVSKSGEAPRHRIDDNTAFHWIIMQWAFDDLGGVFVACSQQILGQIDEPTDG